ncbi:oxidoreductase [Nocardioides sp. DS6]|uniref:Oxidoreductase n=1 Tax=Nocardioides eburneus TaxID=3231482 RepID=A0ABV3SZ61_9ACTN
MTWSTASIPDLSGTIAVVTGPTAGGIGWHTARGLASHGAAVILAGRSWERLDAADKALHDAVPTARTEKVALDLADLRSVRAGAEAIADAAYELGGPLRLLVNNAGVMATPPQRTVDGLDLQLATNHFGPFLLTGLLLESLVASGSGRVVTVASLMHKMARRAPLSYPTVPVGRYSAWGTYAQSKLANLLFTYELDRRVRAAGLPITAVAAHPGYADTHLVANGPMARWGRFSSIGQAASSAVAQTPEAGSWPTLMAATADLPRASYVGPGGPFELAGPPRPVSASRLARDPDAARALWELSEQTTGIAYP